MFWFQAKNVQNSLDDFQYEHARTLTYLLHVAASFLRS